MKIDKLDAHDRLINFKKQKFDISECCQDLINQRPFGEHAFYIFAHARTDEDGVSKRLIWQPRLTRPKPQTNSMLFKAYPGSDVVKVVWMIPARELWDSYVDGKMLENKTICDSIFDFQYNRERLEQNEEDDLDDEAINSIYRNLSQEATFKRQNEEQFQVSF